MLSGLTNSLSHKVHSLLNLDQKQPSTAAHIALIDLSGLQDNQGNLEFAASTEITITGNENRSTGYQWEITENTCGAKLEAKSDDYSKTSNSGMMGAGGQRTWVFETLGEDANYIRGMPCELTFKYKRPWLADLDETAREGDKKQITMTIN